MLVAELLDLTVSADSGLPSPLDIFQPVIARMTEKNQLLVRELDMALTQSRVQSLRELTSQFQYQAAFREREERIQQLEDELRASHGTDEHLRKQLEQTRITTEMLLTSHDRSSRIFTANLLQQFQSLMDVNEAHVSEMRAGSQGRLEDLQTETAEAMEASSLMNLPVPNGSDTKIRQLQEMTRLDRTEVIKPEGRHQVMGYGDGIDQSSVEGERPVHDKTPDLSDGKRFPGYEPSAAGLPPLELGNTEKRKSTEKRTLLTSKIEERHFLVRARDLEDENDQLRKRLSTLEQQAVVHKSELRMAREGEKALQNEICYLRQKTRGMSKQIDKAAAIYREEYQKAEKPRVGHEVITDSGMSLTPQSKIENASDQ